MSSWLTGPKIPALLVIPRMPGTLILSVNEARYLGVPKCRSRNEQRGYSSKSDMTYQ